jgi:hypothetical protein
MVASGEGRFLNWVIDMYGFEKFRAGFKGALLAAGLALAPGVSTAVPLDRVELGSVLTFDVGLDVIAPAEVDDLGTLAPPKFFEASNLLSIDGDLAILAPLTPAGEVDAASARFGDLSFFDVGTLDDLLVGRALDIDVDFAADTVSILYSVAGDFGVNALSADSLVVGVLDFAPYVDIVEAGFMFSDLDFQTADAEIYGATVVPLPAALPLLLAGLGGLVILRARQRAA